VPVTHVQARSHFILFLGTHTHAESWIGRPNVCSIFFLGGGEFLPDWHDTLSASGSRSPDSVFYNSYESNTAAPQCFFYPFLVFSCVF
jgi:hypothetical protein